jgi:hypothetical protein
MAAMRSFQDATNAEVMQGTGRVHDCLLIGSSQTVHGSGHVVVVRSPSGPTTRPCERCRYPDGLVEFPDARAVDPDATWRSRRVRGAVRGDDPAPAARADRTRVRSVARRVRSRTIGQSRSSQAIPT